MVDFSCLVIVGAQAVAILSNRVSQINIQTRFMADKNTWPPGQPKIFTPLLLVHHQGYHTPEQVTAVAELMYSGDIAMVVNDRSIGKHIDSDEKFQKPLNTSTATKEIKEILVPLENSKEPCFVLIEGAPGIGKSVLLKEIAYRWGKTELLHNFELVLLVCLRDPSLQKIKSVDDLLQLFYKGHNNATEIVFACSEYLSKNGGKSLVLLLDGYDEYPRNLQENSLITDILQRQVLPLCGLVVSSRPHASEHLREQATIRVDILGFTETELEDYIKQALPDQPHKIKELTQYLHQQPSIDSICFIPFNLVILLHMYKLGISLPRNSAELYHHFICSTICRHLSKFEISLTHSITDLTNLPEPYNTIIQQLSKLSLEALNNNKLIFTLDELIEACPNIAAIPGAINGFGLLQAVQHFGLYTNTITLNFIHFTIQEFLAANYIFHLPPKEELEVIKRIFWTDVHFNVFSIYISLTKGQRPSFKQFLSGGNTAITISPEFLEDQLKSFHLYRWFNEAGDHAMCNTIEQAEIFRNKMISLAGTPLTSSDMECLSAFLTSSSNKKWELLNLDNCHTQDKGLNILFCRLDGSDVIINMVRLYDNGLTALSSSLISEFTVKHKLKDLDIGSNYTIGEGKQLYTMLSNPSNMLEELYVFNTHLSSQGAVNLFTALKDNSKLKRLNIDYNDITDEACNAITMALERNNCLVTLSMWRTTLTDATITKIVQSLKVNNTLQLIGLPQCSQTTLENVKLLQEVVNKKRENRGYQVKLEVKFTYV